VDCFIVSVHNSDSEIDEDGCSARFGAQSTAHY